MKTPADEDAAPVRESCRSQKRQASRPPSRSLSPLSRACLLGPSNPVSILRFESSTTVSEILLPRTPQDLRDYVRTEATEGVPVYILHGLHADFLDIMGDCRGIDRYFVESHAARKVYQPRDTLDELTIWRHWEYPELVTPTDGLKVQINQLGTPFGVSDLMDQAIVTLVDREGLSVIFRRVSMWRDESRVVIFMDTPFGELQGLSMAERRGDVLVEKPHSRRGSESMLELWETQLPRKETIPSLEEKLYRTMKLPRAEIEVENMLASLVRGHWLQLFGVLPMPKSGCYNTGGGGLLWQMMQSLEQNLQASPEADRLEWDGLLKRLQRTLKFATRTTFTNSDTTKNKAIPSKQVLEDTQENAGTEAILEGTYSQGELPDWEQINRRSLDRITYLGGILLPLTVVSGILGIEGRYGPEGTQFWVFWVASFVSSSICLFIIYLDQLRSLDIWFEVTANDAVEAMFQRYPSALSYQRESGVKSVQAAGVLGSASGNALSRVFTNRNGHVAVEEGGKLHYLTSSGSCGQGRRMVWFENSKESGGKTWKRGSLGWGGAFKKTIGYYRFKGGNVRFNRPDDDET